MELLEWVSLRYLRSLTYITSLLYLKLKANMKERQWRNLIRDIQQQRCILMLGPGLSLAGKEPLLESFSEHLTQELKSESIPFDEKSSKVLPYIAQRFMSIPDIRRIDLEDEAVGFFEKHTKEIPEWFMQLARLPFQLVINTTPEQYMFRALKKQGILGAVSLHYNFKKSVDVSIPEFSSDTPLDEASVVPAKPEPALISIESV